MIDTIILGHALDVLRKLPAESVSCVTTSPPYWGLRDYGVRPVIWDGDKSCKHKWIKGGTAGDIRFRGQGSIVGNNANLDIYPIKHRPNETNPGKEGWYKDKGGLSKKPSQSNFCSLCGAWRGSLGLEPDFNLYVKHLCDIFDEVKRVLRKDGTCFVILGDSYGGSGNASGHREDTRNLGYKTLEMGATQGNQKTTRQYAKCLLDIPYRFSIEMTNRGWVKRNTLIWWKMNCMPSSAKDRFTVDFEDIFFFTKSNKAIFWINEKTLECVGKQPLGIKGIEGKDWEWRNPEQPSQKLTPGYFKTEWEYRKYIRMGKEYNSKEPYRNNAPGCKKLKLKKVSLWSGHDYWFEQQFEEHLTNLPVVKKKQIGLSKNHEKDPWGSMGYGNQGRNKRAVWTIPTQPFPEAHFAVYPETLIEPMIKAGCPEFVCKKCGKARVKIYKTNLKNDIYKPKVNEKYSAGSEFMSNKTRLRCETETKELGYTDCGCNAGFEGGIVLDQFMGAGTTALVALKQRKRFIGIEIKQEYIDMANKRIAKVQQEIF